MWRNRHIERLGERFGRRNWCGQVLAMGYFVERTKKISIKRETEIKRFKIPVI